MVLVVDMQERLAAAMAEETRAATVGQATSLLQAAGQLSIPVLATQQYPRGLGSTVAEVARALPETARVFDKTAFSCCGAAGLDEALAGQDRPQVIMAGMEAHVCVLQTALELHDQGYAVFVAEDAVCSRHASHHANAMHRLRQSGVVVTNMESVLFEWVRDARHEHFKAISRLMR